MSLVVKTGSKYNAIGYSNPTLDRLLDAGDREQDVTKREAYYKKADQMIVDQAALIPLYYISKMWLVKPFVKELEFNGLGMVPHYHTRIVR